MEPSLFSKLELSSSEDPLLADEGGGTDVASIVAGIVGGTEAALFQQRQTQCILYMEERCTSFWQISLPSTCNYLAPLT